MTTLPTSLLGAPVLPAHRPAATAAGEAGGYAFVPVPAPLPGGPVDVALTVRPDRIRPDRAPQDVVALRPELLRAIPHLKAGGPVELVAPPRRGGVWHLDTRTTAVRRVGASGDVRRKPRARFNIPALSREHYLQPAGVFAPGHRAQAAGTAGVRPFLSFALGPEVRGHPGYYELLPLR